jgi:hypothetical protein
MTVKYSRKPGEDNSQEPPVRSKRGGMKESNAHWGLLKKRHTNKEQPLKKTKSIIEKHHQLYSSALIRLQQNINIPPLQELLDEVCLYLQRTLQFLWLLYSVDYLCESKQLTDNLNF